MSREKLTPERKAELKVARAARIARLGAAHGNRIFTFATLHLKGVPYHPNHVRRLVHEGKFPAPIYLSPRRPAWTEEQLDDWLERLARDQEDS